MTTPPPVPEPLQSARERAEQLIASVPGGPRYYERLADAIATALTEAARGEREECAKACDLDGTYGPATGWTEEQANWWDIGVTDGASMCRDRIRNRTALRSAPQQEKK